MYEKWHQYCVFHLSLFCLSTPSMLRSFQRGVGLFCIINIAISTTLLLTHTHTHTHTHTQSVEACWRQARASIKPVWVWEPFKGHFVPDLQSSILLTTAPRWPSDWPCVRRDRLRERWRGNEYVEATLRRETNWDGEIVNESGGVREKRL